MSSYSVPSFQTDYDHQLQRYGIALQQHHAHHSSPRSFSNAALNFQLGPVYDNAIKASHKSTGSVGSDPVWSSDQDNAICILDENTYTENDSQHISNVNMTEYQHVGQQEKSIYDSSPDISGHQGDMVDSPVDETHPYYAYPTTNDRQHDQPSSLPRKWAQDAHMLSQGSTEVPDEYRASIARHSDRVHASGLHGLEGDNDAAQVRRRCGGLRPSHKTEEAEHELRKPESMPVSVHSVGWNLKVADAAYDSLIGFHSLNKYLPRADSNPLPESPVTVPSQRKRSRSPDTSSSPRHQSAQAPLMKHLTPPRATESSAFHFGSPASRRLPPTSVPSPRESLEHLSPGSTSGSASPGCQEEQQSASSSDAYPSSTQSVLKLTTPKKATEKKQALACLFCRERKIACGRPDPENEDQTCNQCARRRIDCEYPKESRRGQHKRTRRKVTHGHDMNQSSPRLPP